MKIVIGSDHAGFEVKEKLKNILSQNYTVIDKGTHNEDSCDYPDFAKKVAWSIAQEKNQQGILVCGSGMGMAISANKVHGVRAALCPTTEHARLSRLHNDTNVLCLGSRLNSWEELVKITETWLGTSFEAGRHQKRIDKIHEIEQTNLEES